MKRLLIPLFIILLCNCEAQNSYTNSEYGFRINFPDNWNIKKSSQKFTVVKAVSPSSRYISYISIAAYPIPKNEIEYYMKVTPQQMYNTLKEEYSNYKIELLDSGYQIINGNKATWNRVKVDILCTKYIITDNYHLTYNGTLFRITNATDGGETIYNELKSIFERSINSLVFDRQRYCVTQ